MRIGPQKVASAASSNPSRPTLQLRSPSRRAASIQIEESTKTIGSALDFLDFVIGGRIIKAAFPQQLAELPGPLVFNELAHGQSHRWTLLGLTSQCAQIRKNFIIYIYRYSHKESFNIKF